MIQREVAGDVWLDTMRDVERVQVRLKVQGRRLRVWKQMAEKCFRVVAKENDAANYMCL